MLTKAVWLGVALGCSAAVFPACGRTTQTCGPSTCTGCCNESGECIEASATNCGSGSACSQCSASQQCVLGLCSGNANFGGGAATGGGGAATGGGGAATGGGGAATGGGGGATGGGGGATGGGGGATGGGGAALPEWFQQAYAKASNTGAGDSFGSVVSLSADGNTLAVGALGEASVSRGINGNQGDDSRPSSGAVYVFNRSAGAWAQQAYLKASNAEEFDYFGSALSLSADGSTLAVGAYSEDSNARGINGNQSDDSASSSGAVYVFTRSVGSWTQQAYLKASNAEEFDYFGSAVSLSGDGNTLAVGARYEDSNATGVDANQADNSSSQSGAVYLFTRSADSWAQQAYLKASNTDPLDSFGFAVSLSADGNTVAIGAAFEDSKATTINGSQGDNTSTDSGAVYVFARNGGVWAQQAYLKASNAGAHDFFGSAITLSADGNTLAIGAYAEDSNATGVNGNQADDSAPESGAVYVFARSAGNWTPQAYLKALNADAFDHFGTAISLSADGNSLAVGARYEASSATGVNGNSADNSAGNSGAVYIFSRSAELWWQQAYLKASNTEADDSFGGSISLSGSGHTLAVGADGEDSNAQGIDGNQASNAAIYSGSVYVLSR